MSELHLNLTALHQRVVQFRRDLHRIPELDRDLPETTAYLMEVLSHLSCEVIPAGDAGFCALFRGERDGGCVAFRSDMDALPVTERNEIPYKSCHAGKMHACGHDGHMSILLGLALALDERQGSLPKSVLLIFQGAEETTGGAEDICASGVLDRYGVEKVYGLHLWPGHPKDAVVCRKDAFMASTEVLYINIRGKSTHVATWRQGIDALEAACALVERLYEMERTEPAPETFRLLRFGLLESGVAVNVVPAEARLSGTLRTYDIAVHDFLRRRMMEIAGDIMAEKGCEIQISHSKPYPAVINPAPLYDHAKAALQAAGFSFVELEAPLMVSEDFSYYQLAKPGLFFHLGTGKDSPLHSSDYQIDEDVLLTGVKLFLTLLQAEEGIEGEEDD